MHALRRSSPTSLIIASLLLGVACGLFFGEYSMRVKWLGDAYIRLLQMAVLPYVTVTLVANTGRLSLARAGRLVRISLVTLSVLWLAGMVVVLLLGQTFPDWQTGSFFSTSYMEEPEPLQFVELFVPSNPFFALANNVIPSVVVFSLGLGTALIGVPNKEPLLQNLDVVAKALSRLNHFVVRLAPIGVFAIVANAVGTMPFREFELLQAYLVTVTAGALILVLGLLPMLVSLTTPIGYGESLRVSRDAMITAFVLGNAFAVLPLIIDAAREMLERHNLADRAGASPEALVPLAYPFPDLGRIIRLIFIPFASWFYGHSLDFFEQVRLSVLGLVGCFSKLTVTIPWLLGVLHIPSDIFQLYLVAEIYTTRLGDLLKAAHLVTFAVLVSCALQGSLRIQWRRLLVSLAVLALAAVVMVVGLRAMLVRSFQQGHRKEDLLVERDLLFPPAPATFIDRPDSMAQAGFEDETPLQRIRRRHTIRVGVDNDKVPFSYFNRNGDLVGFDIDMAHHLAHDLNLNIEFALFDDETLPQQMENQQFDIVMAGLEGTVWRATDLVLSEHYLDVTLAILVPDHRKRDFQQWTVLKEGAGLTVAVVRGSYFAYAVRRKLPYATVVELASEQEFFEGFAPDCDALVTSAETGSAWTLVYPQYSVVNPVDYAVHVPLYYVTAPDTRFRKFIETWLKLKQRDGTIQQLYDYWVLGERAESPQPRWCIIRDVLGWVE